MARKTYDHTNDEIEDLGIYSEPQIIREQFKVSICGGGNQEETRINIQNDINSQYRNGYELYKITCDAYNGVFIIIYKAIGK